MMISLGLLSDSVTMFSLSLGIFFFQKRLLWVVLFGAPLGIIAVMSELLDWVSGRLTDTRKHAQVEKVDEH